MEKINFGSTKLWNSVLVISVIFCTIVLPVLPFEWQRNLFGVIYSIIYVAALFSLKKRSNSILIIFIATVIMVWISGIFDLDLLHLVSKSTNILFFIIIVFSLIMQIANSREVNAVMILGSIAGYLLLGLVFSFFVSIIIKIDPGAYTNLPADLAQRDYFIPGVSTYYSFVTMGTLGYGDISPLTPIARSLSTFIVVSGQFYIAIIVALLVGKFAANQSSNKS